MFSGGGKMAERASATTSLLRQPLAARLKGSHKARTLALQVCLALSSIVFHLSKYSANIQQLVVVTKYWKRNLQKS